jgi:hypothetical protein
MTVYQGEDGWGGPVRVLIEHGQATAARCLTCGTEWKLEVLVADDAGRVLGPLICPAGCGTDDPAGAPGPARRAGFRPDEPTLLE